MKNGRNWVTENTELGSLMPHAASAYCTVLLTMNHQGANNHNLRRTFGLISAASN